MKKCIKCGNDLQCDAEYCDECGALQWKLADSAKKFIRFQQILTNILFFLIIFVQLYIAAFYKNNISSTDNIPLGLISSAILMFIVIMVYDIIFVRVLIFSFGIGKKSIKKQKEPEK